MMTRQRPLRRGDYRRCGPVELAYLCRSLPCSGFVEKDHFGGQITIT